MKSAFWTSSYTSVTAPPPSFRVEPEGPYYFLGSCFAESLGHKLQKALVPVSGNAFGPSYNPLSLARSLEMLVKGAPPDPEDFFLHQGLWRHPDFHSLAGRQDRNEALDFCGRQMTEGSEALKKSRYLLLTLGSAFYWFHTPTQRVYANCHRLPQDQFQRKLGELETMTQSLGQALRTLKTANPDISVILSLSPVRYLREGMPQNLLSKSLLRVLIENLSQNKNTAYFPAYEIMIDELRDYRWYDKDRVHPSPEAVDYIVQRFMDQFGSPSTHAFWEGAQKRVRRQEHRPFQQ